MKRLVILGSTGSVGENALKVVETMAPEVRVAGLAARRNVGRLVEQARAFSVPRVALSDPEAAREAQRRLAGTPTRVLAGPEGLVRLVEEADPEIVLTAVVGVGGLLPSIAALRAGRRLAVASKEILVAAGALVMGAAREGRAEILPVDSEHCAIFQCLLGQPREAVRRILLTASGGPFRGATAERLRSVTVREALAHPSWKMGPRITVDSATLMNKGLEILEARWLFDLPLEKVDVVIHPQSIVHSMVEFVDGTVLAQMGLPDMRSPIQYALTYPQRLPGRLKSASFPELGALTFEEPDPEVFPSLMLAREAGRAGGTMPAVLNAADEVAVERFLQGEISFPGIWETVESVMERHEPVKDPDLEAVLEADRWARKEAVRWNS